MADKIEIPIEVLDQFSGVFKKLEASIAHLTAAVVSLGNDSQKGYQKVTDEAEKAAKAQERLEREARKAAKALEDAWANVGKAAGPLVDDLNKVKVAALAGITAIVGFGVKAQMTQEDAIRKLETAMRIAGTFSESASKGMQEFASSLQKVSIYGDEALLPVMALLQTLSGGNLSEVQRGTQIVADMASALGIDLHAAALMVGKAMAGEFGTLTRYGIVLDEARVKAEGTAYVMGLLEEKFGGAAAQNVQTFSGRFQQLNNTIGDMLEESMKPLMDEILRWLNTGDNQRQLLDALKGLFKFVGDAAKWFAQNIQLVVTAIGLFIGLRFAGHLLAIKAALAQVVTAQVAMGVSASGAAAGVRALDLAMKGTLIGLAAMVAIGVVSWLTGGTDAIRQQSMALRDDYITALRAAREELDGLTRAQANQMIAAMDAHISDLVRQADTVKATLEGIRLTYRGGGLFGDAAGGEIKRLEGTLAQLNNETKKAAAERARLIAKTGELSRTEDTLAKSTGGVAKEFDTVEAAAAKAEKAMTSVVGDTRNKLDELALQIRIDMASLAFAMVAPADAIALLTDKHGEMALRLLKDAQSMNQQYAPEIYNMALAWITHQQALDKNVASLDEVIGRMPAIRNYFQEFQKKGWLPTGDQLAQEIKLDPLVSEFNKAAARAADAFSQSFLDALEGGRGLGRAIGIGIGAGISAGTRSWIDEQSWASEWWASAMGPFASIGGQLIGDWLASVFGGPTNEELLASSGEAMGKRWGAAFTAQVQSALQKAAESLPLAGSGKLDVNVAQYMPGVLEALLEELDTFGADVQRKLAESIGHGVNYLMDKMGLTHAEAFAKMGDVFQAAVGKALEFGTTLDQSILNLMEHAKNLGVAFEVDGELFTEALEKLLNGVNLSTEKLQNLRKLAGQVGVDIDAAFSEALAKFLQDGDYAIEKLEGIALAASEAGYDIESALRTALESAQDKLDDMKSDILDFNLSVIRSLQQGLSLKDERKEFKEETIQGAGTRAADEALEAWDRANKSRLDGIREIEDAEQRAAAERAYEAERERAGIEARAEAERKAREQYQEYKKIVKGLNLEQIQDEDYLRKLMAGMSDEQKKQFLSILEQKAERKLHKKELKEQKEEEERIRAAIKAQEDLVKSINALIDKITTGFFNMGSSIPKTETQAWADDVERAGQWWKYMRENPLPNPGSFGTFGGQGGPTPAPQMQVTIYANDAKSFVEMFDGSAGPQVANKLAKILVQTPTGMGKVIK